MVVGALSLVQKDQTRGHNLRSMQYTVEYWYMVVETLSLVQNGQTRGCSMQWNSGIWWWGNCLWCKKVKPEDAVDAVCSGRSTQWMQYAVCSRIEVYGDGDIVFSAKMSNQWMQWMQWSNQWMQWMQYAVDAVCSMQ